MKINHTQQNGIYLIISGLVAYFALPYIERTIGLFSKIFVILNFLISIAIIGLGLQKIGLIRINEGFSQNLKKEDSVKGNANPGYLAIAGKELKKIVYAVLLMLVTSLLTLAFIPKLNRSDLVALSGIVGGEVLLCNIYIVICIYQAGDNLEKAGTE